MSQHRQRIEEMLRDRELLEGAVRRKNEDLAREVVLARRAGHKHKEIADWFGITRDGLSKFTSRHWREP